MKFNTLVEIRDYLQEIPEDKWIKEKYYGDNGCACAVGHIAKADRSDVFDTENALDILFDKISFVIERVNDNSDSPKEGVINLLNEHINQQNGTN